MRSLPPPLALAPLVACLLSAPLLAAPAPPATGLTMSDVGSFHFSSPLSPPRAVRLSGSNGAITVTPSTDGKLDVRTVLRDGDGARLRVVAREDAAGVAVCVLFADESADGCKAGSDNRPASDPSHRNAPTVDLVARIPPGVALRAGTLNGAIQARGATGEVRASTLNGDVDVSGANVVEATTLNGNVTASFAGPPAGPIALRTNNGNVKVTFPAGADADVEASTVHGEIVASFPMSIATVPGGHGPKSGHATLGKGGAAKVEARAINGNVELRSAK